MKFALHVYFVDIHVSHRVDPKVYLKLWIIFLDFVDLYVDFRSIFEISRIYVFSCLSMPIILFFMLNLCQFRKLAKLMRKSMHQFFRFSRSVTEEQITKKFLNSHKQVSFSRDARRMSGKRRLIQLYRSKPASEPQHPLGVLVVKE